MKHKKADMPWKLVTMSLAIIFLILLVIGFPPFIKELAAQVKEKIRINTDKEDKSENLIKCNKIENEEQCKNEKVCLAKYSTDKKFLSCEACPKTCKEIEDKAICEKVACNDLKCEWIDKWWPRNDICEHFEK